jgi:hypothetical protein
MADDERGTGISRRQAIKRGAAAAGVVWAVPTIQSFTNPAAAAVGTPTPGGDCPDGQIMSVFVKYEVGGSFIPATTLNPGTCIAGGCASANQWAAEQMNLIAIVDENGDRRVCITIPDNSDFLMIAAAAAKEGNTCDDTPDNGSDPLPGGRTVCFVKDEAGGVSNVTIEISACVPAAVAANC